MELRCLRYILVTLKSISTILVLGSWAWPPRPGIVLDLHRRSVSVTCKSVVCPKVYTFSGLFSLQRYKLSVCFLLVIAEGRYLTALVGAVHLLLSMLFQSNNRGKNIDKDFLPPLNLITTRTTLCQGPHFFSRVNII